MERDPDIGYSFSLSDIIQSINMTFYDMQPRWGVIPQEPRKVSALFFFFFAGAPPGENRPLPGPELYDDPVRFTVPITRVITLPGLCMQCRNTSQITRWIRRTTV